MLEATSRILGVDLKDLGRVVSIPTGSRSEVQRIRTRSGEHVVAKRYIDPDAALRFQAEASALQALRETGDRPALVPLLRGADRDALVVVMDVVDGPSVEEVIRGADRARAVGALEAYARAIGAVHRAGRVAMEEIRALRAWSGFRDSDFWPSFARDQARAAARLASASEVPAGTLPAEIAAVVARTFESERATVIHWDT